MISRRTGALLGAALSVGLLLAGCSGGGSGGSGGSSGGAAGGKSAASATSLSDFGSLKDLEAAAKKEGSLNVIALPHDWANYGAVLNAFTAKYPDITVNEATPDASSAQEIQAAKTNKGLDTAPDVFDLGLTVALQNTSLFAPYQVAAWKDIPKELKESSGLFVGDYGGYLSIGYDSSRFPKPTSLDDLLGPKFKGAVAINGDPTQAGAAFAAIGLATVQRGGTLDDFQPGIDYFAKVNKVGNFLKVDPDPATVASGETPVVFDWDYVNAAYSKTLPKWKVTILPGKGIAGYYNQAINKEAPHPAAARLWEEFLYTDKVQNLYLAGGARPARADVMDKAGTIDKKLFGALPPAPTTSVVPTDKQSAAGGALLGREWAAAIG